MVGREAGRRSNRPGAFSLPRTCRPEQVSRAAPATGSRPGSPARYAADRRRSPGASSVITGHSRVCSSGWRRRALTARPRPPVVTVARGSARRFSHHRGGSSSPPFDATTTRSSPSWKYVSGVVRCRPYGGRSWSGAARASPPPARADALRSRGRRAGGVAHRPDRSRAKRHDPTVPGRRPCRRARRDRVSLDDAHRDHAQPACVVTPTAAQVEAVVERLRGLPGRAGGDDRGPGQCSGGRGGACSRAESAASRSRFVTRLPPRRSRGARVVEGMLVGAGTVLSVEQVRAGRGGRR